jgi:hypothetical protein
MGPWRAGHKDVQSTAFNQPLRLLVATHPVSEVYGQSRRDGHSGPVSVAV